MSQLSGAAALKRSLGVFRGHVALRDVAGELSPPLRRWTHKPSAAPYFHPDGPEVILSPHFDDAVLSAWHVLTQPGDVRVVNIFTAAPPPGTLAPWDRVTGATDSSQRMRDRRAEDAVALARADRVAVNLNLPELSYRRWAPSASSVARAIGQDIPTISRVHAPAGIGNHPDHFLVRLAAYVLWRAGVPVELYADIPYAIERGWPDWVSGRAGSSFFAPDEVWTEAWSTLPWDAEALEPKPHTLSTNAQAAKLEALRLYETQYSALSGGELDFLADPRVLAHELSWAVGTP